MSAGSSSQSPGLGARRARQFWVHVLSLLLIVAGTLTGALGVASPASAATVYELTGEWEANTPDPVASGDVVVIKWRGNVNDDQPAPSNDPVPNVTITVTVDHGYFQSLPDSCLTTGVDPVSSISADGKTMVCNFGTARQGSAAVFQTGIVADG